MSQYSRWPVISSGSGGVSSLNGETGALTLVAGSGITITPSGGNITIASTGSGAGTVTSVAMTVPSFLSVSGSPITTAGTLAITLNSESANTFFAAPNGSAGAPTFRVIVPADIPTLNQNTTGTAANITATSNSTLTTLSALSLPYSQVTGAPAGTVTSIALTTPGVLYSVSGSPITTSGTLALALISQTANTVLAGPASGGSANPSFRTLVSADIPNNAANTTGTATNVTGIVATTNGGTGLSTVGAANTTLVSNGTSLSYTAFPSPYIVSTISSNTSAVSGTTYLANSSGGSFTITLPAPVSGAFIGVKDGTGSFQTNPVTIAPHTSEMIEGLAASKQLFTNWGSWSFFSDGTNWFMGPF